MRKIFLLTLFILTTKGLGQTYTIEVTHEYTLFGCHAPNFHWTLSDLPNSANIIGNFSVIGNKHAVIPDYITGTQIFSNVPKYHDYNLNMFTECSSNGVDDPINCHSDHDISKSAVELIKTGMLLYPRDENCFRNEASITAFKPNVTITNYKNPICSGEQLDIRCYDVFPKEAYHWQYSTDNQVTWIDVPYMVGNNPKTNDTPQTAFSINDLLGSSSEHFFGKTIHFRLGYGQNRPLSNVIPVTYSPCGPIINSFAIEKPDCNGGKIKKIDVFFKDDLKAGETLKTIYLRKMEYKGIENDNSPLFQNTSDIVYSNKKHSIPIIDPYTLENGMHYQIIYQTFLNGQPRGVLYSPIQQYLDPTAVTCSIKVPENILCSDGTTSIEIIASGGTGTYYFYKDNIKLESSLYPEVKNGKYYINNLIGDPAGKAYKILVTDTNGCYE
jgi:hypothetical protein